jgi:hypothetical protein
MNKLTIEGNWNEIKGKLKQKYGNLTTMTCFCKGERKKNYMDVCKKARQNER